MMDDFTDWQVPKCCVAPTTSHFPNFVSRSWKTQNTQIEDFVPVHPFSAPSLASCMVDHSILIWIWHSRIFTLSSAVFFIAGLGIAHIKGCWLPTQPSGAERQIPMCKNNVLCECCCSLSLELQTSQEQKYILGDRACGIQIPSDSGDSAQQRVRPDWSIVLAYEFKLRKEAM